MNAKTKYLITKAVRLGILCVVLTVVILVGSSVLTGKRPTTSGSLPVVAVHNSTNRVNINTATLQELMDLPTIGQVIGSRIIEYRQQHGPFKHASDIIIVKGISEHKFRQLEDLITVE